MDYSANASVFLCIQKRQEQSDRSLFYFLFCFGNAYQYLPTIVSCSRYIFGAPSQERTHPHTLYDRRRDDTHCHSKCGLQATSIRSGDLAFYLCFSFGRHFANGINSIAIVVSNHSILFLSESEECIFQFSTHGF